MRYAFLSTQSNLALLFGCCVALLIISFIVAALVDRQTDSHESGLAVHTAQSLVLRLQGVTSSQLMALKVVESFVQLNASLSSVAFSNETRFNEKVTSYVFLDSTIRILAVAAPSGDVTSVFNPLRDASDIDVGYNILLHARVNVNNFTRSTPFFFMCGGTSPNIMLAMALPVINRTSSMIGFLIGISSMSTLTRTLSLQNESGVPFVAGNGWRAAFYLNSYNILWDERSNTDTSATFRHTATAVVPGTSLSVTLWKINVAFTFLSSSTWIIAVIMIPIGIAVLLIGAVNLFYSYIYREYDGSLHAPKQAPFGYVSIGVVHGSVLWSLYPERFLEIMGDLKARVLDVTASHHAYQTRVHAPHSFAIVSRSIDAAIHLSFAIIEDLQRKPILLTLSSGNASCRIPIQLVCAVHLCKQAQVSCEPEEREFLYDGRSVLYASKLSSIALSKSIGAEVWLSRDAADAAGHMRNVEVTFLGEFQFRWSVSAQEVFVATDPTSDLLVAARESALQSREGFRRLKGIQQKKSKNPFVSLQQSTISTGMLRLDDSAASNSDREGSRQEFANLQAVRSSSPGLIRVNQQQSSGDNDTNSKRNGEDSILCNKHLFPPVSAPQREMFMQIVDPVADRYMNFELDDLLYLFVHYFNAFEMLWRPFSAEERSTIFRRLSELFSLPQSQIIEHLAVSCVLQHISRLSLQPRRRVGPSDDFGNSFSSVEPNHGGGHHSRRRNDSRSDKEGGATDAEPASPFDSNFMYDTSDAAGGYSTAA